jgi:UDP-glucose:glycoprotein glucosyltransferase
MPAWIYFLVPSGCVFRPDHAVSLGVTAPWYEVPLFDQILSFMADISIPSAKQFLVTCLRSFDMGNETFLWEQARKFLSSCHHSDLKARIDTKFYVPRVEMFREVARSLGGSSYPSLLVASCSDRPSLPITFEFHQQNATHLDFDISYGTSDVYVYANFQDRSVVPDVLRLIDRANFTLRPTSKTAKFGVDLRGFGIEMRPFKYSMEYGVKDSSISEDRLAAIPKDNTTTAVTWAVPDGWVNLTNLDRFGSRLLSYIQQEENRSLPQILRDLTANYPLFVPRIMDARSTWESFNLYKKRESTTPVSLLNGKVFDIENLDIFTLLDQISHEKHLMEVFKKLGLNTAKSSRYFKASTANAKQFVLDYDSDVIMWVNDLEKDAEYSEWSTNTMQMMDPQGKSWPKIPKNLINAVAYVDVTSAEGIILFVHLLAVMKEMLPIRVGIVPFFSLGNPVSRKVAFAFFHLAKDSVQHAIQFLLLALSNTARGDPDHGRSPPSETEYAIAYNELVTDGLTWNNLYKLYDSSSPEFKMIANVKKMIAGKGICETTLLVNGKPVQLDQSGQSLLTELQQVMVEITKIINANNVYDLNLFDIKAELAKQLTSVPTFNGKIMTATPKGLGITKKPLSKMLETIDLLSAIKWTRSDPAIAKVFYILYTHSQEAIDAFKSFMQKGHKVASEYAINPKERLTDDRSDVLIVNGRVFRDLDLTQPGILPLVEIIANRTRIIVPDITIEAHRAISFINTDWQSDSVIFKTESDIWSNPTRGVYVSKNGAAVTWDLIVEPFTRNFQRIADMICYVDSLKLVNLRLAIIPPKPFTESSPTMATFYRSALTSDRAVFTMLNDTTTYSTMPDMPNSWVFESMKTGVDLDNILLKELAEGTHEGVYVLTGVLSEGSCHSDDEKFAEGAELAVYDGRGGRRSDTIVMMSNGYWQLATTPGIWQLELGGPRTKKIYQMISVTLPVYSFAKPQTALLLKYQPGMEGMKVYNVTISDTSNTTRVDVFSVASGHLYERLLKIMMVSVRRNSKFNVKFWLLKAFLSPQFKAALPILSSKYNFSYQLVSYKWPHWLRPQHEKQRIIWGNKILFLDVLFPLDLDRVIYIDSDQVVRTDLIELMRMDFGDAPYAFTPFCESRPETEPFRFWKRGYWAEHLKGQKYHISALFVVNLQLFRKLAAGDVLRLSYEGLYADPQSLANLDQDLPNFAQGHIPIYSLPQNWLWCETWCSDETLAEAKTIDLCNNPLTKKPKLFIAQTRITEWPELDAEVRNVTAPADAYQKFFLRNNSK